MKNINIVNAKSLLTRSNLPETEYCINPYIGCLHKCIYCYARFMKRFTGHKEAWGEFIDIKTNATDILDRELKKSKKGMVLLSSVTDPYNPLEKKYEITRAILLKLLEYQFPVSILTKSDLVIRDIDIFKLFQYIEIGITITTTSDTISTDIEPHASLASRRIAALKKLKEAGVQTYVFIGPVLPEITDLENIFKTIAGSADKVMAEALNPRCGNWDAIISMLRRKYPSITQQFISDTFDENYWIEIENKIKRLCVQFNIPLQGYFIHGASKHKKQNI